MFDEKNTVLEWVETYPDTEIIFKSFDKKIGKCILCECLFDSIEAIAQENAIDLRELLKQLYQEIL